MDKVLDGMLDVWGLEAVVAGVERVMKAKADRLTGGGDATGHDRIEAGACRKAAIALAAAGGDIREAFADARHQHERLR